MGPWNKDNNNTERNSQQFHDTIEIPSTKEVTETDRQLHDNQETNYVDVPLGCVIGQDRRWVSKTHFQNTLPNREMRQNVQQQRTTTPSKAKEDWLNGLQDLAQSLTDQSSAF